MYTHVVLWILSPDLLPPPDEIAAEIVEKPRGGARPLSQGRAEPTGV